MRTADDARRDPIPVDVFSKRPRGQMRIVLPHNANDWVYPMVRYRIGNGAWWFARKTHFVRWAAGADVVHVAQGAKR